MRSPYPREQTDQRERIEIERAGWTASYRAATMMMLFGTVIAVLYMFERQAILVGFGVTVFVFAFYWRAVTQATLLRLKGLSWRQVPRSALYGFWLDWYERVPDYYPYTDEAQVGRTPPPPTL